MDQTSKVNRKSLEKAFRIKCDQDSVSNLNSILLDNTTDSIILFDFDGNILYANETWCQAYGYTKEELPSVNLFQQIVDPASHQLNDHFDELEEKGEASFESIDLRKDSSRIIVEANVRIIDFNGKKLLLSVIRDITERKKAEEELRLKEQILDKASDAIILRNHEGKIIYANEEAYRARGYAREEFIGMDIFHLLPAERAKTSEQRMKEVLEKGSITFESVYTCKDRTLVPAEFSMNTIKIGNDIFVLSIIRDITERKKAERELRLKEQILDSAMDSIILRDSEGTIVYANEIAYQSLGYNKEEFIGMNLRQLLVPEEARLIPNRAQDILKNSTIIFESILTRKDGSQMPIEVKASSIESGGKQFFIAVNRDISQRKEMEEYIKQLAYYDTLTGLPNRALFNDRFALALEHAVRYQHMLALMMMDLDHFKDVNDSLGHEAGDSLLKEVASRLVSCMRKIDTVSRMGGDEFVLLMPQMNREEDVVTLVQRMVETFQQPFTIRNNDLIVTFSLGIALYPHDGNDLDSLVRSADIAMYQVKNRGRHGYLRYTPDMGIKDTVQ